MTSKPVRNLVFGGSYNSDPNLRFSTFAGTPVGTLLGRGDA